MWENFFHAVCRVGVFVICAQAILCFRPRQSHEKYLKLLVSVMILVQIFQPVARILGAEGSGEIQERIAWFQEQLDQEMARSAGEGMVSQELLDRMTLSQVRERLEEASQNGPLEGSGGEREGESEGESEKAEIPRVEIESVGPVKME